MDAFSAFELCHADGMGENEGVSTQSAVSLPSRWAGTARTLPPSLSSLNGPDGGVVDLPSDIAWSGRTRFDLSDRDQRYLFHMTVLTSAITTEHYTQWLNADLLRSDWARLRLPRVLRGLWQERFPELAAAVARSA
ncbi:hypothetical protein [Planomonospora sp. ID82291]|uniref:hypothetical protein n=1 Tax=Planomonospora sp. ID82291 TaxID=2738136 RepID=UPI0018C3702A|nr:hypothetical protein [Planomonospora sp. ID82291]MBG0818564.1 hypothetical protein [Planomonospora sp. ID82291]